MLLRTTLPTAVPVSVSPLATVQPDLIDSRSVFHFAWLLGMAVAVLAVGCGDGQPGATDPPQTSILTPDMPPLDLSESATNAGRVSVNATASALLGSSPGPDVLVLEANDFTNAKGNQIGNKTTGLTITSEGPTAFAARTDFSSFDVVFLPCVFSRAPRNAAKNNSAFQAMAQAGGRVVLTGLHADDHGQAGAGQFLKDAITWIAGSPQTGILALCDFSNINWDFLPFPGATASSAGVNPHDEDVTFILPKHPIFANTTDGAGTFTLDNWHQSVHAVWNTFGPGNGGYEDDGFLAVASSNNGVSALVLGGVLVVQVIQVDIDIKPGSDPNSINPRSKGVIPVAILGSADFDVNDVDVTTLTFGPDGATPAHRAGGHVEDVNGDGFDDLVSHYRTQDTGVSSGDTEACVDGATTGGTPIHGCDAVRVVR